MLNTCSKSSPSPLFGIALYCCNDHSYLWSRFYLLLTLFCTFRSSVYILHIHEDGHVKWSVCAPLLISGVQFMVHPVSKSAHALGFESVFIHANLWQTRPSVNCTGEKRTSLIHHADFIFNFCCLKLHVDQFVIDLPQNVLIAVCTKQHMQLRIFPHLLPVFLITYLNTANVRLFPRQQSTDLDVSLILLQELTGRVHPAPGQVCQQVIMQSAYTAHQSYELKLIFITTDMKDNNCQNSNKRSLFISKYWACVIFFKCAPASLYLTPARCTNELSLSWPLCVRCGGGKC